MQKEEEFKKDYQSIICPKCFGNGVNEFGFNCRYCKGAGLGIFHHGRFFYWGEKIGVAVIRLKHLYSKIKRIFDALFFLLSAIGLISLAYWFYSASSAQSDFFDPAYRFFWRIKSPYILIFWIGIYADLFIFYRLSEEKRRRAKIWYLKYDERKKVHKLPNNWEELKKYKKRIEISTAFNYRNKLILDNAFMLAHGLKHSFVEPLHIFYASLQDDQIASIFLRLNVDPKQLAAKVKRQIEAIRQGSSKTIFSIKTKELFIKSYLLAVDLKCEKVEPMHLLFPLIKGDRIIEEILYDFDINRNKVSNIVNWFVNDVRMLDNYQEYKKLARFKPSNNMNRAYTAIATPILDNFSHDLTALAKLNRLEICVSRDGDLEKIFSSFESGLMGMILVGDNGVGKKNLIGGLAQLMVREEIPSFLRDKRLVEIDAASLIGGADAIESQRRLSEALREAIYSGNIVLFIDNLENLMGISSGSESSLELSEVLASAIEKKQIYVLSSVNRDNYSKYIKGKYIDKVMENLFIEEPHGNQAIQIVESKISALEGRHKIFFSYNAIEQAVNLSDRYMHDSFLPAKAIKILERTAVDVLKERGEQTLITKSDVSSILSEITKIPLGKFSAKEGADLLNLEKDISEYMVGQKEAVDMVSASLRRARAKLREGKRPIANFLFLGPTGVGKTELAKTVSRVYFGDEKKMIRLDMSEFQHRDSIKKMIGSPDGAKGHLTEAVKEKPFSLILLDEFEKAHHNILNLFLQIMDDGRLTDGEGREVDFTNSIIVATSNTGAFYIQKEVAAGTDINTIKNDLINEHLNKTMRPELINRFDGVIVFKPLSENEVFQIAKLILNQTEKLLDKQGLRLKVSDIGLKKLAHEGYDPKFGARPLRRVLQNRIDNDVANKILSGELERRDTVFINDSAEVEIIKAEKI